MDSTCGLLDEHDTESPLSAVSLTAARLYTPLTARLWLTASPAEESTAVLSKAWLDA